MSEGKIRVGKAAALFAVCVITVAAQYPPPGGTPMPGPGGSPSGPSSPSYGSNGKTIGIAAGAVAAGAVLTYWALHRRPSLVGCVQQEGDNKEIRNDKDGKLYRLRADSTVTVKSGERVALKGKKTDTAGADSFRATEVVKDYGDCASTAANARGIAAKATNPANFRP